MCFTVVVTKRLDLLYTGSWAKTLSRVRLWSKSLQPLKEQYISNGLLFLKAQQIIQNLVKLHNFNQITVAT